MKPLVSIVVAARDPGYGGGLLHRAQVFLNGLFDLSHAHGLVCELVFVEWNPVQGLPRFREALARSRQPASVNLRFIEVPQEVHQELPNADRMNFHHMIARNVGIRRARGDFILATSPDVLFNQDLVRFLAGAPLSVREFYRIDREDLSQDLPVDGSVEQQLALCGSQDLTLHRYYGSIRQAAKASPLGRVRGWVKCKAMIWEYERHRRDPDYRGSPHRFGQDRLIIPADGLHRNAAGEFFLMHRDCWHEARGYTELPTFGHADSILCWTADTIGLRQVILEKPCRLFHQRHDRIEQARLPITDWCQWHERYVECKRAGTALIANGENWGLWNQEFPERCFEAQA